VSGSPATTTPSGEQSVVAAIDIGSNSIKMTVGRCDDHGQLEQFDWASEVVRLGHGLDASGRLDPERIEAAVGTMARFAERAKTLGAMCICAVATEAVRAAANGAELIDRVRAETSVDVRVIAGDEEARLTFLGLAATSDVSGLLVVADVGGASTEVIVAANGVMRGAESLPLGSGRLTDRLVTTDPPTAGELAACEREAGTILDAGGALAELSDDGEIRLAILGGTGEYLARLVPDGAAIDEDALREVLARLTELPAAEVAILIEAPEARARVLPAGIAIVAALALRVSPVRMEVARSGIRAGLLLEALQSGTCCPRLHEPAESRPRDRLAKAAPTVTRSRERSGSDATFREAVRSLIAQRWAAVWQTIPAALTGEDIEGVHDVRVASRRLRAAMDIGVVCFPNGWYKRLHRAAKEITGALGEVRDRDVLLEALHAQRDTAPLTERPGIDRLIDRVEAERLVARATMERYLRDLIGGELPAEIERRFGPAAVPAAAPAAPAESVA
jgi:exopolyphosphatase/pppGpp-phosphohydrolase